MTHFARLASIAVIVLCFGPLAHATPVVFTASLDGLSEDPPNASPGTGFAQVDFDIMTHTMRVQVTFSDLIGTTTAAHIHAPTALPGTGTAGIATETPTFVGFPLGVTAGTYDHTFDTTLSGTFSAAFLTASGGTPAGAESALLASLLAGTAYLNVHTTAFTGGEIRGFLQAVPEPATLAVFGLGLGGLALLSRRRRIG